MKMKKTTQIASLCITLGTVMISSNVFAGVNNCRSYYPKAPYNCVVTKAKDLPSERADFSAFEASEVKVSAGTTHRLRSVPRDVARKLRSQSN